MKNKVAILYICTGNYVIFWENFYKSFSRHFLPGYQKKYFVFTESNDASLQTANDVRVIYQKKLGWPYDTLYRFRMFYSIDEQLKDFDYIFFFNANMICLQDIDDRILPNEQERLVVVKHPGFFDKDRSLFTYETNPQSLAYIPDDKGEYYFMGGFNGGIGKYYRELIKTLKENIDYDLQTNKLIAIWHDESHLNRYMLDRSPKILSPAYGYPEGVELPFEQKIIILDKNRFGGHNAMRGIEKNRPFIGKIKKILHFFKI
ncbi:MAG: hypothetical protein K2Q24_04125 [Chitinophagaceae bacterium]|jgi:hypothetical protein|nr:hypothetical protein [Chitinophagaceae bacterium]